MLNPVLGKLTTNLGSVLLRDLEGGYPGICEVLDFHGCYRLRSLELYQFFYQHAVVCGGLHGNRDKMIQIPKS